MFWQVFLNLIHKNLTGVMHYHCLQTSYIYMLLLCSQMPLTQAVDYYEKIQNASSEMAKVQPIPLECEKKAFSVLGCAHVFCSSDEKALLFKTSRGDCEEIPKWYVGYYGVTKTCCTGAFQSRRKCNSTEV